LKGLARFNTDANVMSLNVVGDCSGERMTAQRDMKVISHRKHKGFKKLRF